MGKPANTDSTRPARRASSELWRGALNACVIAGLLSASISAAKVSTKPGTAKTQHESVVTKVLSNRSSYLSSDHSSTLSSSARAGIVRPAIDLPIPPGKSTDNAALPLELLHDTTPAHSVVAVMPKAVTDVDVAVDVATNLKQPRVRRLWMEVTAYCACSKCCGPNAAGITASGHDVSYNNGRFVAADTERLPFGTKLIIPGYGDSKSAVEVIDRGGAIKGNKLDVFFASHQEAKEWGRRQLAVLVIE